MKNGERHRGSELCLNNNRSSAAHMQARRLGGGSQLGPIISAGLDTASASCFLCSRCRMPPEALRLKLSKELMVSHLSRNVESEANPLETRQIFS